ncbi:hypothetical protein JCM5353_007170 [Sporobolomyces roseus]
MARDKEAQPHAKKKRAFQVGPKLAKGAYTGHAQRIKKTLIHKAKVKKEYAKALKEAGYSDPSRGRGREEEREEMDTGPIIDVEKEEEEKERLRRRLYGDDLVDEENEMSEDEFEGDRKGDRSSRFTTRRGGEESDSDSPTPSPEPEEKEEIKVETKSREPLPSQATAAKDGRPKSRGGKGRGKKPTLPPPVPEVKKTQLPPKRPKLTEAEVEKIREKKRAEKRDAGRKTQRGQAKLGAKMEGLLGKIQRSLAK